VRVGPVRRMGSMIGARLGASARPRWRFRDDGRYARLVGYVLAIALIGALIYLNVARLRRVDREYRAGPRDADDPD